MHELSVCQSLLNQVDAIARRHHGGGVAKVTLRIGPLAAVEPQLLMQAFPLASAGTIARDAELVIESPPIRVHCPRCEKESDASINRLDCRHCGNRQTQVISGDELLLVNVELTAED